MKTKLSILLAFLTITFSFAQDKQWTLQECIDHAADNNLSVQRAKFTTDLRKEDIASAKGSKLPGVSGSGSQNYSFGSTFVSGFGLVTRDNRSNNFGINTSVTLFNGFRIKNIYEQSKVAYEASQLDLEKMKNDISLNIVNSYLNVLFNKENLIIAEAQLEISLQQYEQTKTLVEEGVQPKGNLLEVESTKINDENAIVTAQNNVDLALLTLSQILQIPNAGFDVKDVPITIESVALLYNNTNEIFEKAVGNQPEIKSAELGVTNAETQIKIAKADYLPSLTLFGGLNTFYNHRQGAPGQVHFGNQLDNNFGQSFGLSLNIPIYSRGQVKANVNRAKINQKISEVNLSDEKQGLREAIERAYINAKATLKEYEAAKKSVDAQELSFEYAQQRYNLGVTNSFDFEQVKNRLVNAQSTLASAKYNFIFRTKLLEFYYGIPIVIE